MSAANAVNTDAVVVGGGPAGSAVGRTLASWGHSVVILTATSDRARGLAESLPPSTQKLLGRIGALDAVERAGFYRATGNTAWWASREPRVERFGDTHGYQVFRPEFDRVLLDVASEAGADVRCDARVRAVAFDDRGAHVDYEHRGTPSTVDARIALDCSGRVGVIGRRYRCAQAGHRTYSIVGVWLRDAWDLPDPTHTVVETFDDGWAWSVPVDRTTRHVGVMVDGLSSGAAGVLEPTYRAELAKTPAMSAIVDGAVLQHVWACDASLYHSTAFAGEHFLLVGDAASFIDPLSSFGVKKALASAWIGAVTANTWLLHTDRRQAALDFFSNWERQVYSTNLKRSRDFAREAFERHPYPFWAARSAVEVEPVPGEIDEEALFRAADVQAAFERLKMHASLVLVRGEAMSFTKKSIIHGREIVVEDAIALREAPDGVRYIAGVDLLKLGEMACRHRQVSDLFEAYCRSCGAVSMRSLLGTLSVLVARGVLIARE